MDSPGLLCTLTSSTRTLPSTARDRFLVSSIALAGKRDTLAADFDTTGRLIRVKGLTRDITRRKQAEMRQDLLIAELDHRVKNVLARVGAVVRHTRRRCGTTDEFVKALLVTVV